MAKQVPPELDINRNIRGEVFVREDLTFEKFNYTSDQLDKNTYKKVVFECKNCHQTLDRYFLHASSIHRCELIQNSQKRCNKCETWKDLNFFLTDKRLNGGISRLCKECTNKSERVRKAATVAYRKIKVSFNTDFALFIRTKVGSVKSKAKQKNIPFNLDANHLTELWDLQGGKCFYSNMLMDTEGYTSTGKQNVFAPSLDRKVPSLGYIEGNVVWCCHCVNCFKLTMTTREFITLIRDIKWNFNSDD